MEPVVECLVALFCHHPGQLGVFADGWRRALAQRCTSGLRVIPMGSSRLLLWSL